MIRISFLVVATVWAVGILVALFNIGRISPVPFYILFGGFTFCLGVVALLEQLRNMEKLFKKDEVVAVREPIRTTEVA
jgi:hypothetical protein